MVDSRTKEQMETYDKYEKIEIQKKLKKIKIAIKYNMDRAMMFVEKEKWKESLVYSEKAEKLLNLERRLIEKEYILINEEINM